MSSFKNKSLDERTKFAKSILEKHPGKIPLIIESQKDKELPPIHKFIIPNDLTVGQVIYMLRRRIKLRETEAIYLFFDNCCSPLYCNPEYSPHKETHNSSNGFVKIFCFS